VYYLPFGYDERLFNRPSEEEAGNGITFDVLLVGGADNDRVEFVHGMINHGIRPVLVGGYWDRYPGLREFSLGLKSATDLRLLTARAKVNICLVRRANRDGHVMRSFEIPACGGFMIAEDTADHRAFFGGEGEAVLYFSSPQTAAEKCHWALDNPEKRIAMATRLHRVVTTGRNTYADRLNTILERTNPQHANPVQMETGSEVRADDPGTRDDQ
jgi:spore maturation protein CgeB